LDEGAPDDETIAAQWSAIASNWDARYGEEGDRFRVHLLNPALLGILGDVAGKRILDAGCGNGYLCRMLARRGAKVVGVDLAPGWIEIAQSREPELDIEYYVGSIAHMPFLADGSFEAVVSVCVLTDTRDYEEALQEMYRVLVPGGILAMAIMHPCFASPPGGGWERHPVDSTRPEDRWYWRVKDYFQWTWERWYWEGVGTATGFHRPLSDYMQVLLELGFRLTHFTEPRPSPELVAADPATWASCARIPLFVVLGAIKE
jgi:SAM-dependent methyltransferase